jgi:hypothetical protein
MHRSACHVAVALGCFLYSYEPGDIAQLAPEILSHHDIRHVQPRQAMQIQNRFRRAHPVIDEHYTLHSRTPTEHERDLVHRALCMFAP